MQIFGNLESVGGLFRNNESGELKIAKKPSENYVFPLIRLSNKWLMAIWIKASLWRVNTS